MLKLPLPLKGLILTVANAEGERQNRDESDARIEQQQAEAVAGVLKKVLKHRLITETRVCGYG